jgi:hypothetical protein
MASRQITSTVSVTTTSLELSMSDDTPQRRQRSQPGEPMDLANMRSLGVRSLAVTCFKCHHRAVINVDAYPDDLAIPDFGERLVCIRCGTAGADVRPNWREQPERESLTGAQCQN